MKERKKCFQVKLISSLEVDFQETFGVKLDWKRVEMINDDGH